jgi:hypothetical protein
MSGEGKLDRKAALGAKPEQAPYVRREERANGGLTVTVNLPRAGWLKWMSGSGDVERSFGLDVLGREVYEACDGRTRVKEIIHRFARTHSMDVTEAEISVTTFLKTMMTKGLILMAVDKKALLSGR